MDEKDRAAWLEMLQLANGLREPVHAILMSVELVKRQCEGADLSTSALERVLAAAGELAEVARKICELADRRARNGPSAR